MYLTFTDMGKSSAENPHIQFSEVITLAEFLHGFKLTSFLHGYCNLLSASPISIDMVYI